MGRARAVTASLGARHHDADRRVERQRPSAAGAAAALDHSEELGNARAGSKTTARAWRRRCGRGPHDGIARNGASASLSFLVVCWLGAKTWQYGGSSATRCQAAASLLRSHTAGTRATVTRATVTPATVTPATVTRWP
jgi:hypothetical protein